MPNRPALTRVIVRLLGVGTTLLHDPRAQPARSTACVQSRSGARKPSVVHAIETE